MGTRSNVLMAAAAVFAGLGAQPSPAMAYCSSSERSVFFVEFEQGSAALPAGVRGRLAARLLPSLSGGRYVDSYFILASGDIAEGSDWEAAPDSARAADRKLGEARSASIRAMLKAQPKPLRTRSIEVKVRDNRQVFSDQELQANPALNPRIRAGIVADVRTRAPKRRKGEPVPLC